MVGQRGVGRWWVGGVRGEVCGGGRWWGGPGGFVRPCQEPARGLMFLWVAVCRMAAALSGSDSWCSSGRRRSSTSFLMAGSVGQVTRKWVIEKSSPQSGQAVSPLRNSKG